MIIEKAPNDSAKRKFALAALRRSLPAVLDNLSISRHGRLSVEHASVII
jgi:hypothetical protein